MQKTVGVAILLSLGVVSFARTEPGSFLERHVASSAELVRQLNEPVVLDRYVRHFGMEKRSLATWFRTLRLKPLTKARTVTEYNVRDDGIVRKRRHHLKVGTLVFVDPKGDPILRKACGNPIYSGSDHRDGAASASPAGKVSLRSFDEGSIDPEAVMTQAELPPDAPGEVLVEESGSVVYTPATMTSVERVPALVEGPVAPTLSPVAGAAPGLLSWGAGFGWLGAGSVLVRTGGDPGSGTEAVPEPATLTALALASAAMLRRRKLSV